MPKVLQTSATPNPQAIKFHMDCQVVAKGSRYYPDARSADSDPVGCALFAIPGVATVFYVNDVVTINKHPEGDWNTIIPQVADVLEEMLSPSVESKDTVQRASTEAHDPEAGKAGGLALGDVEAFAALPSEEKLVHINAILDETIRPGLAGDGGGLDVLGMDDLVLRIHYEGACGTCPSAFEGTLNFIEDTLRQRLHPSIAVLAA